MNVQPHPSRRDTRAADQSSRPPSALPSRLARLLLPLSLAALISACGGGGPASSDPAPAPPASGVTALSLSTALFEEKALSASGQQACASCHASDTAHADTSGTQLPVGGASLDRQGFRSSPSMLYLDANGPFRFVGTEAFGGFTWDGRANTRAEQAGGPLLDQTEMANPSIADVASRVRALPYYADFRSVFALPENASDQLVFDTLRTALEQYQKLDTDYLLFNSRYDRFLDGQATLTAQEQRGLSIFENPAKGNCASCHPSRPGATGERPLFTTFGYAALGLPRNPAIAANADPAFFDMGLCGPKRTDLSHRSELCGQFKIPTLRNIELTAPYFHNGSVATLEQAVSFYATRDIDPARWYPVGASGIERFNDLPAGLRSNVLNTAPFGLRPGDPPVLTAQDVADLAAFLRSLTDDQTAAQNTPTVSVAP